MELLNIQQVVVGSEMMTSPAPVMKSEPVDTPSLDAYQHDSLQCFHCLITFSNPKSKERHMRKNHREEYKMSLQQTDTIFTCYMCDRSFPSSEKLTQHQATHGKEDRPFRCTYCHDSFRSYPELTQHRRQKCAEKHFTCKDCGSVFRVASQLRTHIIAKHTPPLEDANAHRCGKCSQGFATEEELKQHNNVKHQPKKRGRPAKTPAERETAAARKNKRADEGGTGEQDSEEEAQEELEGLVDSPGKDTDQQGGSSEPQLELKIPCPEDNCDLVFPSVTALRAHKREVHLPKQLKTFTPQGQNSGQHFCPTCGKTFSRESNLNAHQKIHTEAKEEKDDGKR